MLCVGPVQCVGIGSGWCGGCASGGGPRPAMGWRAMPFMGSCPGIGCIMPIGGPGYMLWCIGGMNGGIPPPPPQYGLVLELFNDLQQKSKCNKSQNIHKIILHICCNMYFHIFNHIVLTCEQIYTKLHHMHSWKLMSFYIKWSRWSAHLTQLKYLWK